MVAIAREVRRGGNAQRIRFPPNTDAPVIRVPLRFVPEGAVGRRR